MNDYVSLASHKNNAEDYQRAKELRKLAPITEQKLWNALRLVSKESSIRFRRQHPISPYIVDFVCLSARMIIEVDGLSHDARQDYDQKRDNFLRSQGFKILRFSNQQILENASGVADTIMNVINNAGDVPLPQPLPQGEGS